MCRFLGVTRYRSAGDADVLQLTALSRATLYREIEHGGFPKPIKFGAAARWLASEIAGHIDERKSQRGQPPDHR